MASAYVLYVGAGEVGAYLELLRRICDPTSRSLPHVTVRYSARDLRPGVVDQYSGALVDDLILSDIETFDDVGPATSAIKTLIIGCESESLEWLSYKPDFPNTYFHITVYDGPESKFALQAYNVMRRFSWQLRFDETLGDLENVNDYRARSKSLGPDNLTPMAKRVLDTLLPKIGAPEQSLGELSTETRLRLLYEICQLIHLSTHVTEVDTVGPNVSSRGMGPHLGQAAFWSETEIGLLSPRLPSRQTEAVKRNNTFLTPPELAYDIADAVLPFVGSTPIRFMDPAFGPGIFYAALRRASAAAPILSATGIEIDKDIAARSAHRWRRAGVEVVNADFLELPAPAEKYSLLLANPPYLRSQSQKGPTAKYREAIRSQLGIDLTGRADIYAYFMLAANKWLADGAIAAWLLPSEVLSTDYGRGLRSYLTTDVELLRVHAYEPDSSQFDNARVSSTVVIYRKAVPHDSTQEGVVLTSGGSLASPLRKSMVPRRVLKDSPKWSRSLLATPDRPGESVTRIGDLFDVRRGIATGANAYFVISDTKRIELSAPTDLLLPLLPRARDLASNIVLGDDEGLPLVENRRWVINAAAPMADIKKRAPLFAQYLDDLMAAVGTRTLVRERRNPLVQEVRPPALFVFVYMAKRGVAPADRFVLNLSQGVVLNNYLGLTPRPHVIDWLANKPENIFKLRAAIANIDLEELERYGRVYVSDLLKLEPKELRSLRLPTNPLDG